MSESRAGSGAAATPPPASALRALLRRPRSIFALGVIGLLFGAAFAAPWITPYDPYDQMFDGLSIEGAPLSPSADYWLGTDLLGRDLFSRLVLGAQTSLIIGLLANGIAVLFGASVGIVAGYFGGVLGGALMRFTDLMMAFPALLLAIVLAAIFKPSLLIVALVIAMVNWVQMARVIYTETRAISQREFIDVQRAIGAGSLRIIWKHILPHLIYSIIVFGTLGISTTVLLEATLSYLGVGVQPPTPSWGNIIFENQTYFATAPWLVFFPGLLIVFLALSFNLLGDALRDVLDPKLKGRH